MNRLLIATIIILLTAGCGPPPTPETDPAADPDRQQGVITGGVSERVAFIYAKQEGVIQRERLYYSGDRYTYCPEGQYPSPNGCGWLELWHWDAADVTRRFFVLERSDMPGQMWVEGHNWRLGW